MSTQKPRALDVPLPSDDARASLLRALHLLGGEESMPAPAGVKPALYGLSRILGGFGDQDRAEVTLTKLEVGPSYWYEVVSGHALVTQARASGKTRIGGTLVATRTYDPSGASILGFSLCRGNRLVHASIDPELRALLFALGVPSR